MKFKCCFWNFYWKFELSAFLNFRYVLKICMQVYIEGYKREILNKLTH